MLDHVGIAITNYPKSKKFYETALAPLGYKLVMEFGEAAGFGAEGKPDFWIGKADKVQSTHVAFVSADRKTVEAFYNAAMAAGGKDNGKPGIRKDYHPNYYGAFVHDPDGNNIEAVCHSPA